MSAVKRFKDRIALVTGGASGIGRATAERFAAEGAGVAVADTNVALGQVTCREIESAGGRARFVEADVTRAADAERMVQEAVAAFGRLDILVTSAGASSQSPRCENVGSAPSCTSRQSAGCGGIGAVHTLAQPRVG
jgi:NAD(P)-dependent dehydrogenase (short-subunit alcohol dehydrogenase family)